MKLGFVSAILPELTLDEVFAFAAEAGYSSVEVMCWPPGKVERRYAGVTHLDAENLDPLAIRELISKHGVGISGPGLLPQPPVERPAEAEIAVAHLHRLIDAAAELHIGLVNSFVGRDPALSVEANWPRFLETWTPIIAHAEHEGVRIGIENCPMLFTIDEWPGGKNLATTPPIWRKMFEAIPSPCFGLNFDPSHFVWQQIDYLAPLTRVPRPDLSRPRQGRADRPEGPRGTRRPLLPQALAHAETPRPGRRPLGSLSGCPRRGRLRRPRRRRGRGPRIRRVTCQTQGFARHQPPPPDSVHGRVNAIINVHR